MRTEKEVKYRIKEIMKDSRYPHRLKDIATIEINAPLALEQLAMQCKVSALKWVLNKEAILKKKSRRKRVNRHTTYSYSYIR